MKILKSSELDNDASVYVVLGQVGTGKTSLVNSYEGKRLVLSFDDSYSTLKRDENLTVVAGFESKELIETEKFLSEIEKIAKNYDLVVFDNISALEQTIVDDMTDGKAGNNKNGMAAYGATQKILRKIVRWATTFNGDVLFTMWSKIDNGFEKPAMNDNAFNSVAGYANVVGRTYVDGEYKVALQPSLDGVAKNRVNKQQWTPNSKFWKAVKYREKEVTDESNRSQSKQ